MVAEEVRPEYDDELEEQAVDLRLGVRFEIRVLYPSEARLLLGRHQEHANRKTHKTVVSRYARDITSGQFRANVVDLIAIDDSGIRNGKHRVTACSESGKPIVAAFAYAADFDWLYSELDKGERRNWAQDKELSGLANAGAWAAVIKWLYRYQHSVEGGRLVGERRPTVGEMDSLFEENQGIHDSLAVVGHKQAMEHFIPRSILVATHYLASKTDEAAATEFIHRALDGVGQPDGSSILALRRALLTTGGAQRQFHRDVKFAFTVKAWLAYEENRPLKLIKWLPSEPFPRFRTNWPDPD